VLEANARDPSMADNLRGVDDLSESECLDCVRRLNDSIDKLMVMIMARIQDPRPQTGSQGLPRPVPGGLLHEALGGYSLLEEDARQIVVEFFLRDLVLSLLYFHFFEGHCFFGVGSDSLREHLDQMMGHLEAKGEFFGL
jgi:hypothetical protein